MRRWSLPACALLACALTASAATKPKVEKLPENKIPAIEFPDKVAHDQTPVRVKVLVYEFNPHIPGKLHSPDNPNAKPKRLAEVGGWSDSRALAQGYMEDMLEASGGYIQFDIVEWNIVDAFQKKRDGYTYTPETYMKALRGETEWYQPDGVDYHHEIRKFGMSKRIDAGEADEIWWFGLPYFGYWESVMIGPESYWINAPPQTDFPCKRRFAIMGWNSERGVAEMIHNMGHRTESAMSHYYNGWNLSEPKTNWDHFSKVIAKGAKISGVGHCHYPPNGESDYDYANENTVKSTAPDWLDFPNLTGKTAMIDRETWGGPDYHRNFQIWFFTHLPKAPGINEDGRVNNWWEYIYNFNAYDSDGNKKSGARPIRDRAVEKDGAVRPSYVPTQNALAR
jgi:hypothetical protein